MPTKTLLFSAYDDTGASGTGSAWGVGNSTPPFPSGYTLGGDPPRINGGMFSKFSGTGNAIILDDTALTSNLVSVSAVLGSVGSDSQLLVLCDNLGTGYVWLVNSTNVRCFALTNFVLGSQVGSSISFVCTTGHTAKVERNNTTGVMTFYTQGVSRGTVTQSNSNTSWRAGVGTRNSASIASLTSEFTSSQSITSINSGNPIEAGQSSVPVVHSGFGGAITSITTNRAGVTASVISGNAASTTFSISGWIDGGGYPLLDNSVTFTFSRTGESAAAAQAVTVPDGYSQVTFSSPDTNDDRKFSKMMADAGLTVDGSTLYYKTDTIPDLVINPDSSGNPVANGGTFEAFLREVDTGLMRAWTITINEQGEPTDMSRGLTAKSLTATRFTATGLTAVGL